MACNRLFLVFRHRYLVEFVYLPMRRLLTLFFLSGCFFLKAQTDTFKNSFDTKIEGTIFFNYHSDFGVGYNEFEVNRAYLGASRKLDSIWTTTLLIDIGSPDEVSVFAQQRRYAYFRKVSIEGKFGNYSVFTGIIDMNTYRESEKLWGKRYLYKSMQDEFRFGVSADLGIGFEYHILDFFSVDVLLVNGKGYNQIQSDNTFKLASGVSWFGTTPFIIRIYADAMRKSLTTINSNLLVGIKTKRVKSAFEFAFRTNDKYRKNFNRYGYSLFLTYEITPKVNIFTRYDYRWSNKLPESEFPWDLRNDGSAMIGGVEYVIHKHIRASLNYQDWVPYAKNLPDRRYLYCNVEVKF